MTRKDIKNPHLSCRYFDIHRQTLVVFAFVEHGSMAHRALRVFPTCATLVRSGYEPKASVVLEAIGSRNPNGRSCKRGYGNGGCVTVPWCSRTLGRPVIE